ncbi:MAG TPA: hypothetical protein VMJ10_18985 [Kofleriaceae bacterium]|nr:hypothetical protein [Kofleriaceae bacterium]
MQLPDPRRQGPRVTVDGWCGVVTHHDLRHASVLELSELGVRLERVFDPRVAARTVALELEVPGIDEIIWARADVVFARLTPLGGWHASGQPRLLCRAGLRIADAASRHLRLLRDYVFATRAHELP